MTAVAHVHHFDLPAFDLPWAHDRQDVRVFRRWLGICLTAVITIGVAVPLFDLPEPAKEAQQELPVDLAQILLDKPEPIVIPEPPKPEPKVIPEEKPVPVQQKPKVIAPTPEPQVADVREKARESGLLAFKDAFADMRESVDVSKLQDTASIQRGTGEAATIDRSLITSKTGARSAGVNVSALSRDTGGVALSGRETTKVSASDGAIGAGGVRASSTASSNNGTGTAGDARSRSIEDIRRVFDSNKGSIFAIYNRALRGDPSLQGKVVLELVISPTGEVMNIQVVASELADPTLVERIVSRVRMFDFGSRDVRTTTISYPVHFLPT